MSDGYIRETYADETNREVHTNYLTFADIVKREAEQISRKEYNAGFLKGVEAGMDMVLRMIKERAEKAAKG